jgi:phosphoadenosine phosphosulfate reductase
LQIPYNLPTLASLNSHVAKIRNETNNSMKQLFDPPGRLMLVNRVISLMDVSERLNALYRQYSPEDILVTSSFGASSALMLHIIKEACPEQDIIFIDTGYHFAETYAYKKQLSERLNLRVIDVKPDAMAHQFSKNHQLWQGQSSRCCYINKVKPLEPFIENRAIWVSGLMRYQNAFRANLDYVTQQEDRIIKYYPLIDLSQDSAQAYLQEHNLPEHPLVAKGYNSIGCEHCTKPGNGRNGRWAGTDKQECGLHLGVK